MLAVEATDANLSHHDTDPMGFAVSGSGEFMTNAANQIQILPNHTTTTNAMNETASDAAAQPPSLPLLGMTTTMVVAHVAATSALEEESDLRLQIQEELDQRLELKRLK